MKKNIAITETKTKKMKRAIKIEEEKALESKNLLSFASALNSDLYDYLCKGCMDGWDCDWDKLDSRLKPGVNIEVYRKIKSIREAVKLLIAGVKNADLKMSLGIILKNIFELGLKLPITEGKVRSVINREPIKQDYFLYLLKAKGYR